MMLTGMPKVNLYIFNPMTKMVAVRGAQDLKQPLDFAAVTDHAELLGEVRMCLDQQVIKI